MKKKKVYVTLQNGDVFQGYRFGADGDALGELVFSTGMVGYVETLTDPSAFGQIVVQTFPLIGNYGVTLADMESDKAWVSAYIVREVCDKPSNFRMEGDLENFLKSKGVIGVYGVDTRQLTKILREEGVMNARISDKKLTDEEVKALAKVERKNALESVATKEKGYFASENGKYTVALWNFGAKNSTIKNLTEQGYNVVSMPAYSKAEEILELGVDGVVLSDGPGNPAENQGVIEEIKKALGKKPIFGIGLGYQMLAIANGAKTEKQKYGHRGSNQPVKNVKGGEVYISAQNHGYTVIPETVKEGEISFVNANDDTCEGIDYDALNAFGVQFTPESCGIGHVENIVYNKFLAMVQKEKENA